MRRDVEPPEVRRFPAAGVIEKRLDTPGGTGHGSTAMTWPTNGSRRHRSGL